MNLSFNKTIHNRGFGEEVRTIIREILNQERILIIDRIMMKEDGVVESLPRESRR